MTVLADVSGLAPMNVIELFELDTTVVGGTQVLRWTQDPALPAVQVFWQGLAYAPFPILATGFVVSANGPLPRPTLTVSNIGGLVGAFARSLNDGLGSRLTRRRTLVKYLDATNFPSGNPQADPNAHFPDEIFYIARRVTESPISIQFEAAVSFDVQGVHIPKRQVIASTCSWVYRSADCAYAGPPVADINNLPTSDPAKDRCSKSLTGCKLRFGQNGVLNSSAFPASLLVQAS